MVYTIHQDSAYMSRLQNKPPTNQQQNVLNAIAEHMREHGFAPSLREIGAAIGLPNLNAVRGHLAALEKKGYVTRAPDKARSIQLVHSPSLLSQVKRKLHDVLRTDEGVLHRVVYGLAWATWQRRPVFTPERAMLLSEAIDREAVEHGWTVVERKIEPDHVVVAVSTWPNHSPEQTVRRLQGAGKSLQRRHPEEFEGGPLWDRGYAVTTDLGLLEALVAQLLGRQTSASSEPTPESFRAGTAREQEQISS
jgi:SOS-response transcriptional repressor LexA